MHIAASGILNSRVALRTLEASTRNGEPKRLGTVGEYAGYLFALTDPLKARYPALWTQLEATFALSVEDPLNKQKATSAWLVAFNLLSAAELLHKHDGSRSGLRER
jgi:hypothetical protein